MRINKSLWLLLGLFGAATLLALTVLDEPQIEKVQGITLDARRQPPDSTMHTLRDVGITHISVTPFGWQQGHQATEIAMNPNARWYSEGDAGITALGVDGQADQIQLIIKPHLWLRNRDGKWRSDIGFDNDADWEKWEASYRTFMMHYANLAEKTGADMLCIGTELARSARERPAFWRSLIAEIRTVYSGELFYAGNWWEEYAEITFWDDLDYIGVQAYFPLSEKENPTMDDLIAGWTKHKAEIETIQRRYNKPILFSEIGYRSVDDAAREPWRWLQRDDLQNTPNYSLQADLYDAFFQTFWHEPWFAGAIFWKWNPNGISRRGNLDFTPQEKPALDVLKRWYTSS